jgi:hypothetical protein
LDAELSLKVASLKTNSEGFLEHFDCVESAMKKLLNFAFTDQSSENVMQ